MRKFTRYPSNYVKASYGDDYTPQFEVGQLVRVRPYKELKDLPWYCDPEMNPFCGHVYEVANEDCCYQPGWVELEKKYWDTVEPDPEGWQFKEEALIPVNESEIDKDKEFPSSYGNNEWSPW